MKNELTELRLEIILLKNDILHLEKQRLIDNERIEGLVDVLTEELLKNNNLIDEVDKSNLDNNLEGFSSILDIINKYRISRQTFYNYRKLVVIKFDHKVGNSQMFSNKEIIGFFKKVDELKRINPEFFFSGKLVAS